MKYSIETLEIELNKIKYTIRNIDRLQDEMFQKHPNIDNYLKKKNDLELAIKKLTQGESPLTQTNEDK